MDFINKITNMAKKVLQDSSTTEVSANDWNITVSDREGNVVQTFNDVTEAMKFARDNGYSLHAE